MEFALFSTSLQSHIALVIYCDLRHLSVYNLDLGRSGNFEDALSNFLSKKRQSNIQFPPLFKEEQLFMFISQLYTNQEHKLLL